MADYDELRADYERMRDAERARLTAPLVKRIAELERELKDRDERIERMDALLVREMNEVRDLREALAAWERGTP